MQQIVALSTAEMCAEGVVQVRARPGEHKVVDLGPDGRLEANDFAFESSPDGQPSCRGPRGFVASHIPTFHIPTLVGDTAGEARS